MFNSNFVLLEKSDGNSYLHLLTELSYMNEKGTELTIPYAEQISPEVCQLISNNGTTTCCAVFDNYIKFFGNSHNEDFNKYISSTPNIFTNYKHFCDIRFTYTSHLNHSMYIIVLAIEDNGDLNQWYYDSTRCKNWEHYRIKNDETCTIVHTTCITLRGTLYYCEQGILKKISKDLPSNIKQAIFATTRKFSEPGGPLVQCGYYMLLNNGDVCVCDTKYHNIKFFNLSTKIKKISDVAHLSNEPYAITENNKVINLQKLIFVEDVPFGNVNDILSGVRCICLRIDDYFYVKYNYLHTDKFQQVMYSDDNGITLIPALFKSLNVRPNIKSAQTFE